MTNNSRLNFRAFDKIGKKILSNVSLNFLNEVIESHHDDVWEVYEDIPPQFGGKDNICTLSFDDCEIMQWTGLTDREGKNIFEGDVCGFMHKDGFIVKGSKYIVNFKDGCFCAKFIVSPINNHRIDFVSCTQSDIVLGNIYQNPDLIGEVKEEK